MTEKRLVGLVYHISTDYKTIYEDLSHTDWEYLERKEEERRKTIKRLLND